MMWKWLLSWFRPTLTPVGFGIAPMFNDIGRIEVDNYFREQMSAIAKVRRG